VTSNCAGDGVLLTQRAMSEGGERVGKQLEGSDYKRRNTVGDLEDLSVEAAEQVETTNLRT